MKFTCEDLAWEKMNGLIPAVVQDVGSNSVLMLAYMNKEALMQTFDTGIVTFYSRSKQRLWTKGETSGNILRLIEITPDCDGDSLLISAEPQGPTCHTGNQSCFNKIALSEMNFIKNLQLTLKQRNQSRPENSYTSSLFNVGINRIAQKVGEEGVEVALAAVTQSNEILCDEIADLFFHILVLLTARQLVFSDVITVLMRRAAF